MSTSQLHLDISIPRKRKRKFKPSCVSISPSLSMMLFAFICLAGGRGVSAELNSCQQSLAFQLTNTFETGSWRFGFDYCRDRKDGFGISAGVLPFSTMGDSVLLDILKSYGASVGPSNSEFSKLESVLSSLANSTRISSSASSNDTHTDTTTDSSTIQASSTHLSTMLAESDASDTPAPRSSSTRSSRRRSAHSDSSTSSSSSRTQRQRSSSGRLSKRAENTKKSPGKTFDSMDQFCHAWVVASQNQNFRSIQVQKLLESAWNPSQELADRLGIYSFVGRALLYDTAVQHSLRSYRRDGDSTMDLIEQVQGDLVRSGFNATPGQGASETGWLRYLLQVRRGRLCAPKRFTNATKSWCDSLPRLDTFERMLESNVTLNATDRLQTMYQNQPLNLSCQAKLWDHFVPTEEGKVILQSLALEENTTSKEAAKKEEEEQHKAQEQRREAQNKNLIVIIAAVVPTILIVVIVAVIVLYQIKEKRRFLDEAEERNLRYGSTYSLDLNLLKAKSVVTNPEFEPSIEAPDELSRSQQGNANLSPPREPYPLARRRSSGAQRERQSDQVPPVPPIPPAYRDLDHPFVTQGDVKMPLPSETTYSTFMGDVLTNEPIGFSTGNNDHLTKEADDILTEPVLIDNFELRRGTLPDLQNQSHLPPEKYQRRGPVNSLPLDTTQVMEDYEDYTISRTPDEEDVIQVVPVSTEENAGSSSKLFVPTLPRHHRHNPSH